MHGLRPPREIRRSRNRERAEHLVLLFVRQWLDSDLEEVVLRLGCSALISIILASLLRSSILT
jgi:hypothetical protein